MLPRRNWSEVHTWKMILAFVFEASSSVIWKFAEIKNDMFPIRIHQLVVQPLDTVGEFARPVMTKPELQSRFTSARRVCDVDTTPVGREDVWSGADTLLQECFIGGLYPLV